MGDKLLMAQALIGMIAATASGGVPRTARTAALAAILGLARPALAEPVATATPAPPTPSTAVASVAPAPSPVSSASVVASVASPSLAASGVVLVPGPPTQAVVHLAVNYGSARLESRSRIDADAWRAICEAPCDRLIRVEGAEMRVVAPGMTASNVFGIEPGPGVARFRVSGGSSTARSVGIVGLIGGLPVAFAGVTLLGLGSVEDSSSARSAGVVTLGVGAVLALAALPLLLVGSTTVRNEHGHYIARGAAPPPLL